MTASEILGSPDARRLVVTLAHFVWQGVAIGVLAAAVLRAVRVRDTAVREATLVVTMVLLAVTPLVTFRLLSVGTESVLESAMAATASVEAMTVHETAASSALVEEPDSADWWAPFQPYVVIAWIGGVSLLSLRFVFGMIGLGRLMRSQVPLPDELIEPVRRLRRRLNVSAGVVVAGSHRVTEAVAAGFLRPMVLLPVSWLNGGMPIAYLEAVIAHELAHVRRWDPWVNLFQRVVETFLFFHPVVWWASERLRHERELRCDELAACTTGERFGYAQALEYVARRRVSSATPLLATGWGGRRMRVLERVKNVLRMNDGDAKGGWWPVALGMVVLGLGVWFAGSAAYNTAIAQEREGDRERGEREVRRDGDRELRERERPVDRPREGRGRDGDRPRPEGDRPRPPRGPREGDRPPFRGGERDGAGPPFGERDGDRPPFRGERDGDRPPFGGERDRPPFRGDRDGERRPPFRPDGREGGPRPDGDRPGGDPQTRELLMLIRELRGEIDALRREVHQLREGGPGVPPRGERPPFRDGERPRFEGDRERPRFDGDRPRGPEGDRPRFDGDRPRPERPRGPEGRPPFRPEGAREQPRVRGGDRDFAPERERPDFPRPPRERDEEEDEVEEDSRDDDDDDDEREDD